METQTRLSHHDKFISAKNITILSISSDDYLHASLSSYIYIYKNFPPNFPEQYIFVMITLVIDLMNYLFTKLFMYTNF